MLGSSNDKKSFVVTFLFGARRTPRMIVTISKFPDHISRSTSQSAFRPSKDPPCSV